MKVFSKKKKLLFFISNFIDQDIQWYNIPIVYISELILVSIK